MRTVHRLVVHRHVAPTLCFSHPIRNKGLFELFPIPVVPLRPLLPPCQLQPALTIVGRSFILLTITCLRFLAAPLLHTNMFRDRSSQRGIHGRNQLRRPYENLLLAIPAGVQGHLSSGCVRFITCVIFSHRHAFVSYHLPLFHTQMSCFYTFGRIFIPMWSNKGV